MRQGKVSVMLLFLLLLPLRAAAEEQASRRHVEFAWEAIEGADSYQLRFTLWKNGAPTKTVLEFKTTTTEYEGELTPGHYKFELRTLDKRGVPGDWGEPSDLEVLYPKVAIISPEDKSVIATDQLNKFSIVLKWQPHDANANYLVKIFDEQGKQLLAKEVKNAEFPITLPVGLVFKWQVTAISADKVAGDPGDIQSFLLEGKQLATPKIIRPFAIEKKVVAWNRPARTKDFTLMVEQRDPGGKTWKTLLEQKDFSLSELKINNEWPPGKYRLTITAQAPNFRPSQTLSYQFDNIAPPSSKPDPRPAKPAPASIEKKKTSRASVAYTYAPFLRTRTVQSETLNYKFNEIVLNSNKVTLNFVLFPAPHQIAFSFALHRIRSALSPDEANNSNSAQPRLDLNANRFSLGANYTFAKSIWHVELDGAYARDEVNIIYTDSPVTVGQTSYPIIEVETGIHLGLNINGVYFPKIYYMFGTTMQSKLTSYMHHEFGLYLGYALTEKVQVAGFYSMDFRPHTYLSPVTGELYRTNMAANVFGGSLIYGL